MVNFFAERINNNLTGLPDVAATQNQLVTVMEIAFGIVAAVALLTIAIAAFNYATASGDSDKISRSKNAIIFALIGIAVAVFGEAIVFVVWKQI
jgi:uncharacterized membrane protein YidH (DUF202 family)